MKKVWFFFLALSVLARLQGNNINWSSPPTVLSSISQNASDAHVAIDTNGNIVVVWVENGLVKSSSKPVGMGWTTPATLSSTGASSPRVVSDSSGNAGAIWLESGIVKAATKLLAGNWSAATALSTATATSPDIAVDSAGDLVAVWARAGNIESSTKLFGASWQNRVTITSTSAATPRVALGNTGANTRAVVVWQGVSGSTKVTYSSTKLISGSWSAQQIISDTNHQAASPCVAVDSSGNALAVWYRYDVTGTLYSNVELQSSFRSSASGAWDSAPATISTDGGIRNPTTLTARVAFDSTGNALALWNNSSDDENYVIESALRPVRGSWTNVTTLVNPNLYANALDASVTTFGDVLTTYLFYNGASLIVQSSESDVDSSQENTWSVPINISSGANNGYPSIAASMTGNVINAASVWINYDGTHNLVVAATGSKTVVLPPSSLSVVQSTHNFGVFTEYYNTLSWHASTDPNVVGYLIFRNGILIGQVGASTLQILDDNRVQSGTETYGVAAIDAQGTQSRVVTINFP